MMRITSTLPAAAALALGAMAMFAPAAQAQEALAAPGGVQMSLTISAQVSIVFESGGQVGVARTSFTDAAVGADATADYVMRSLQAVATEGLMQAAMNGAHAGHADVVAVVYRFDGTAQALSGWAPMGVFVHTTEMSLDAFGKANFSTRVRFLPDPSFDAASVRDAEPIAPAPQPQEPETPRWSFRF